MSLTPLDLLRLALCLLSFLLGSITVRAGSTGFRGDAAHTGASAARGPQDGWRLAWRLRADGPVRSSPAIDGASVYCGDGGGVLRAVELATGRERWRFQAGGAVDGSPAVSGGLVYATSRDGVLHALDAASGALRWSEAFGPDLAFSWDWDYLLSSPTVVGGRLWVGGGDGVVRCLDAATGRVLWKAATGGRVRSSPACADGRVYVGSMDGHVHALDAATGASLWKADTEGLRLDSAAAGFDRRSIVSSPAVALDVVLFGSRDGRVYAVSAADGSRLWSVDHRVSWVIGSPAVHEGAAIVGSSDGRFVHSVEITSGRELWRKPTTFNVFSSATVADGIAYLGVMDGSLLALDAASGATRWRFRAGDKVISTPAVAEGLVCFGSDDGFLYALGEDDTGARERPAARRAVFWGAAEPRSFTGGPQVRDFLAKAGYAVLDEAALAAFLRERCEDRTPSVVVFANDRLPDDAASGETPLLRRYLEAGGKVVWLGQTPGLYRYDPKTDQPVAFDLPLALRLTGVDHAGAWPDEHGARPTEDGRRLGLATAFVGVGAVDPARVDRVLALDVRGRAAAWAKSFGGPPGSGFVRLWGRREPVPDLVEVLVAAEHGLR